MLMFYSLQNILKLVIMLELCSKIVFQRVSPAVWEIPFKPWLLIYFEDLALG